VQMRLITQLVTESTLLASAGGALGIAVARWAIGTIVRSAAIPRAHGIALDARAPAFTAAPSLLTGIAGWRRAELCGLDASQPLKRSGAGAGSILWSLRSG
jgi:hypothetical protein